MHVRPLVLGAFFLTGCTFTEAPRDGLQYACTRDEECPAPMRCQQSDGVCVPPLTVGDVAVASAALEYVPQPNNPHQAVTSARLDTRLRVTVTLDQPVTCQRLRSEPDEVAFGLDEARLSMCLFSGMPRRAGVETNVRLWLDVVDTLGIARTIEVPLGETVRVDTLGPPVADVDTEGRVTLLRAPWGALETAMLQRDRVVGLAGAVEPHARVQVLAFAGSSVLATVDADETGAFGPAEFTADPESVGVLVVDRAGNGSGVVQVRDIVWVVNHSGPSTNPHRAASRRANDEVDTTIDEELALSSDELAAISRDDAQTLTVTGGTGLWQEVVTVDRGALLWDAKRKRVVNVGSQATAVWDGSTWERVADGVPSVALAGLEPRGDRFIALNSRFETFQRRPTDAQWSLLSGARTPRVGAMLFASPADGALYLVGGDDGQGTPLPVLRLDGNVWVELGTQLPALQLRGAWDPLRNALIAFGSALVPGSTSPAHLRLDTDGGVSVGAVLPPERREPCVAYVPSRERVVLAAGLSPNGGQLTDVWEWDGRSWNEVTPPERADLGGAVQCAFDEMRGGIMVVSNAGTRLLRDVNGVVTVERLAGAGASPLASPTGHVGAWGSTRAIVTSGGNTFSFDGRGWSALPAPSPAFTQLVAGGNGDFFGARSNGDGGVELSVLTGDAGWQRFGPTMPASEPFILYYRPDVNGLVVDSAAGAYLAPQGTQLTGPTATNTLRGTERAAFSQELGSMLRVSFMQTFALDAQGWSIIDQGLDPISLMSQPQLIATGSGTQLFRDGRFYRFARSPGAVWTEALTSRGPPPPPQTLVRATRYVAGFNPTTRRTWVFDGAERRTWQLRLEALRPALLSRFVLPPVDRSRIQSVSLRASAFGTGGVRARVWSAGSWLGLPGATNASATSSPGPVELSFDQPDDVQRLCAGDQLVTAVEPGADNGGGVASVSVDYVQLVVRYRLPAEGQP